MYMYRIFSEFIWPKSEQMKGMTHNINDSLKTVDSTIGININKSILCMTTHIAVHMTII